MAYDQDRGPPEKAAAGENTDDRPEGFSVTDLSLESAKKSSVSMADREHVLTALRGAWASDHNDLFPGVTLVAMVYLTVHERTAAAFAFLRAVPPDEREAAVEAAFFDADRPPPLLDEEVMAEAQFRAVASTTREHKATMAATWAVLGEADRQGFLSRVVGREGLLRFIRGAAPATLDILGLAVAKAMAPARWRGLVEHMKKKATRDGP